MILRFFFALYSLFVRWLFDLNDLVLMGYLGWKHYIFNHQFSYYFMIRFCRAVSKPRASNKSEQAEGNGRIDGGFECKNCRKKSSHDYLSKSCYDLIDMSLRQSFKRGLIKKLIISQKRGANQGAFSTINRLFISSMRIITFSSSLKGNRPSLARSTGRYRKKRSYSLPLALLMRLMIRPNPIDTIFYSLFATIILNPLIFFVMFYFILPQVRSETVYATISNKLYYYR